MLELLKKHSESAEPLDVETFSMRLAMDIVCAVAFDYDLGKLIQLKYSKPAM